MSEAQQEHGQRGRGQREHAQRERGVRQVREAHGRPRRAVISGYYGFGNLGDEAVLGAMVSHLRGVLPGVELVAISGDPRYTESQHGIKAVHRNRFGDVLRQLDSASLVISGGGSLLQDVTSSRSILYYLSIIAASLLMGKPVMIYAQGIGPIKRRLNRVIARVLLNRVDAITVRDEESARSLEELGVTRPPVVVAADPVFGLGRDYAGGAGYGSAPCIEMAPRVGIAPREWKGLSGYKHAIAAAADRLIEDFGATVIFLAFHRGKDEATCHEIMDLMKWGRPAPGDVARPGGKPRELVVYRDPESPSQMLAEISKLDLMIGMRLHSLIMAACCKVPLVPISYDPKVDALAREISVSKVGDVETVTADSVYEAASGILRGDRSRTREALASRSRDLALSSRKSAEIAARLMGKDRPTRVDILGCPIDAVDMSTATERVRELAAGDGVQQVVTVNAEIAMAARGEPGLRDIIRSADLVTADGTGVVWGLRLLGSPVPERVAGYDLMLSTLDAGREWGTGIYLLGAAPGVAEAAKEKLEARFPGLRITGTHHGYFLGDPAAEREALEGLRTSGARIFFVALGAPKQEKWVAEMRSRGLLPQGVYIGVGGALDVASGLKKRAPLWMQRAGLEWFYRLVTDPSRLRRASSLPRFVLAVVGVKIFRAFFRLFFNVLEAKSCRVL